MPAISSLSRVVKKVMNAGKSRIACVNWPRSTSSTFKPALQASAPMAMPVGPAPITSKSRISELNSAANCKFLCASSPLRLRASASELIRQPSLQRRAILFHDRDLLRRGAFEVFDMLRDGTVVIRFLQPVEILAMDHALAQRSPHRGETFVLLAAFPLEIFGVDGREKWLHQPRVQRPRQSAFNRRVRDVEARADRFRIEFVDEFVNIPHRAADVFRAAVILPAAADADFLVHRGKVAQASFEVCQLRRNRLVQIVRLNPEPIARAAKLLGRAQNFL